MNILYPDYNNCIANLACSVLKYFGVETTGNDPLAAAEKMLCKPYKNVVVLLLDGMGVNILEENLDQNGFFRRNLRSVYSSVFPPTTVAATTSIDSGLFPARHGWLGWDCYFKEIDKTVTVFRNTDEHGQEAAGYNVAWRYRPYQRVADRVKRAGFQAYDVTPFAAPYPQTFQDVCDLISGYCKEEGRKYIYGYWYEPDGIMHSTGCFSDESKAVLRQLEKQAEALAETLEDTLLIVTADHGHINSRGAAVTDYPKLMQCLVRVPSIEPRAVNFFVKEGFEKQFEAEFEKNFQHEFLLLTRAEVMEKKLFGTGQEHEKLDEMLGDYLAVAISDLSIYNTREERDRFIGVHAGLTEGEMRIPLIAVEKAV